MSTTLSGAMNISASGMTAERFRMDVIASNIANAGTEKTASSDPYRRQDVLLSSGPDGVHVDQVVPDQSPFPEVNDPANPMADPQTGRVPGSNVKPVVEMVDMIGASRAYEANVAAFNAAKGMVKSSLNIGKV